MMYRLRVSSPISGILVLTTAMSAAYTCVKLGDAICAFITERQKIPRPRTRFSENTSGMMFLMFDVLICARQRRPRSARARDKRTASGVCAHLVDQTVDTLPQSIPLHALVVLVLFVRAQRRGHCLQFVWRDVHAALRKASQTSSQQREARQRSMQLPAMSIQSRTQERNASNGNIERTDFPRAAA